MSFYTSLSGINTMQTDLDVIGNNLANAQTSGFKSSTCTFADVIASSILTDPSLTTGLGARTSSIKQQFSLGSVNQTGNSLDMMINGAGFYLTKNPTSNQNIYTRAGSFSLDSSGYIKDNNGDRLQVFPVDPTTGAVTSTTSTSDVQVPSANSSGSAYSGVTVSNTGLITVSFADGTTQNLGAVALANFTNPTGLKQLGSATWTQTGVSGTATLGQANSGGFGALLSGSLEGSNVDVTTQLVNMIAAQQDYQANSKAISTQNQLMTNILQMQ